MSPSRFVVATVERVLETDPAAVWALIANPERLREWAGVEMVGYMGTEMPRPGQNVFIKRRRGSEERRAEIESWDAGTGISCLVHSGGEPTRFRMELHPEVGHGTIGTRIRLQQRSPVSSYLAAGAEWWMERSLIGKLKRIERAVVR